MFLAVMRDFTKSAQEDMHLMYDVVNGKARAALLLYQERFPDSLMPNQKMFERLIKIPHTGT